MKGILSSKGKIEINPIALNYQFTIHSMVPAPHTIIDGIKKLEPGHTLNVTKSGETHLHKYFDVNNVELKKYSDDVCALYPSVGENLDFINSNELKNMQFLYRKIDQFSWQYCNKGFFNFKNYIPKIIQNIS